MNNLSLPLKIAIGAGALLIAVVIFWTSFVPKQTDPWTEPKPQDDTPAKTNPIKPEQAEHDELDDMFLGNFDLLPPHFDAAQYMFINSTIRQYTLANFGVSNPGIEARSFKNTAINEYEFNIINDKNERLFYVIAIKQPDGTVKIDFFK